MASSVATPLERRFGRIAGLTVMTSTSSLGNTSITMQFDLNRDVAAAARDVQAAINAAGGELPANLPTRPQLPQGQPGRPRPSSSCPLRSDTLPLAQVFDAANSVLPAQKMSQIEGVGAGLRGRRLKAQPAVRVQLDGEQLANMGLSSADVRNALAASTSNQPKGLISGPRATYSVAANDQLLGADAYRKLVISYQNGGAVRLGDVATVFDDVENNRLAAWIDGKRAVLMIVRREPGANILATLDRIKEALPRLRESISPAIETRLVLDRTETIRASVRDVERTLVLSVILVTLVVFLFLRSARATLIPTVAVPLSLVGTFGVMYLAGYSLDNLSLMALAISTGFVVDDAIVVTENIARFIEEGMPPVRAALAGAKQIGFTIVSITVSLIAVFIPILLMGGIIGRLFREFAVTLSIAIVISALVSLTVTPTMAAYLLRPTAKEKRSRAYLWSERFFEALQHAYDRGITWVLNHAGLMLVLTVATVGVTVWLAVIVPKGLFPQQDTGLLSGFSEASQDISSTAMRNLQEKVNAIVQADPDVGHTVSFFGGQSGSGNTGTIFVPLKPFGERKSSSEDVINRLRPKLARIPGMTLFLQSVQDLRIGGRGSRTQYQYTLQDANLDVLRTWAPRVLDGLRKIPELRDVNTDQQTAGLELEVMIDRDSAARLGITMGAIDDALYDAYGQRQVATSYTASNYYRVVLEATPDYQNGPDQLSRIYVRSTTGAIVPLPTIAKFSSGLMPLGITHQGQFPSVTLSFNLAPGKALGDAIKAIDGVERKIGMPASINAGFSGTAQAFGASLASEPWLILAALVCVYLVLGVLYESLVHPLTILSTLPSAVVVVGALPHRAARRPRRLQHHRAHRRRAAARHRQEERHHDDRLRARGRAPPGPRAEGGHPPRVPAALPPHPHDDPRGALRRDPARHRLRRRVGAAPSARHRHRGGPRRLAAPQPLHDARDLPVPRPPAPRAPPPEAPPVAARADRIDSGGVSESVLDRVVCVRCSASLDLRPPAPTCAACGGTTPRVGGIPVLLPQAEAHVELWRRQLALLLANGDKTRDGLEAESARPDLLAAGAFLPRRDGARRARSGRRLRGVARPRAGRSPRGRGERPPARRRRVQLLPLSRLGLDRGCARRPRRKWDRARGPARRRALAARPRASSSARAAADLVVRPPPGVVRPPPRRPSSTSIRTSSSPPRPSCAAAADSPDRGDASTSSIPSRASAAWTLHARPTGPCRRGALSLLPSRTALRRRSPTRPSTPSSRRGSSIACPRTSRRSSRRCDACCGPAAAGSTRGRCSMRPRRRSCAGTRATSSSPSRRPRGSPSASWRPRRARTSSRP